MCAKQVLDAARFHVLGVCLVMGVLASSALAGASFQGLGPLPEGSSSQALGVSADGRVVVGESVYSAGREAFRWTAFGGMQALGDLPGGNYDSWAFGASQDGTVVVGHGYSVSGIEALRWSASSGMQSLGVPEGYINSQALAVSGDGSVVIGDCWGYDSSRATGFVWTKTGGFVMLLSREGYPFIANDICRDGSVVVGQSSFGGGGRAYRNLEPLGTLPGHDISWANGVSGDGAVIVGVSRQTGTTFSDRPFRWTADGGMQDLGLLPGFAFGVALAASGDGSVVVGYDYKSGVYHAFIWDLSHGVRDLQDVLVGDYGLDLNAWHLDWAVDISDDGRTIVGFGSSSLFSAQAWVATIPEPGTVVLLALGVLALFRGRRSASS